MSNNNPTFIDPLLMKLISAGGVLMPVRAGLDFPPGTLTDDATNDMTRYNAGSVTRGTYASRPAAGLAGRLYLCTDVPLCYFDDGAHWQQHGPLWSLPATPLGSWGGPNVNITGNESTAPVGDSTFFATVDSSSVLHYWGKGTLPAYPAPWTVTCALAPLTIMGSANPQAGIAVYDSVGGGFYTWFTYHPTGNARNVTFDHYTAFNARDSNTDSGPDTNIYGNICWLRMRFDGTKLYGDTSVDGVFWLPQFQAVMSGIGAGSIPNHYGFALGGWGAAAFATVYSLVQS